MLESWIRCSAKCLRNPFGFQAQRDIGCPKMSIYIVWLNTREQVSPGPHRVRAISPTLFFQQNTPPHGSPGVLRPGDRIFFTGPKHDIPRHGLPTCFALTVKIRLRTLSRSALADGVLFFHWLSPNWLARNLELRTFDTAA